MTIWLLCPHRAPGPPRRAVSGTSNRSVYVHASHESSEYTRAMKSPRPHAHTRPREGTVPLPLRYHRPVSYRPPHPVSPASVPASEPAPSPFWSAGTRGGSRSKRERNIGTRDSRMVSHFGTDLATEELDAQIGRDASVYLFHGR